MIVNFLFNGISLKLSNRKRLKLFVIDLFKNEKKPLLSLTYVFCTDEYLLSINREFLHHDYYTDILTFLLSDESKPVTGEIYISAERVKDNAEQLGESLNREIHRVVFHGALHLCGYKDKKLKDKEMMTQAEDKYLKMYFS